MTKGSFVAVSTGMLLAGHITVRCKKVIQDADVVYCLVPHLLSEKWLESINNNVVSLQQFYAEGKYRMDSYNEMVATMMEDVRRGKNVCGAFYGHAGIFACVGHKAIAQAKQEGYFAYMEPGVSAEACLYSDLGIDPGDYGVQSLEVNQFLFFDHQLNTKSYILLWQVALAGEHTATTFEIRKHRLKRFVDYLSQWIPLEHEVILYEAQFLPIEPIRADKVKLKDLPDQELKLHTTLVIPPVEELKPNTKLLKEMGINDANWRY